MQPVVRSVNVGGPRGGILPKGRDTGIGKRPVEAIELGDPGPGRGGLGSGVVEDVVSRTHHGGSYQADDAVAREELDRWGGELVRDLRDEAGRSSVVRRPGGGPEGHRGPSPRSSASEASPVMGPRTAATESGPTTDARLAGVSCSSSPAVQPGWPTRTGSRPGRHEPAVGTMTHSGHCQQGDRAAG